MGLPRWLGLDAPAHALREKLVAVETIVRPVGQKLRDLRLVDRQLERPHDLDGRLVLHLDELLLRAACLVRALDQPGLDVDDLHLERELRVDVRETRRHHLRNAQLLGDLDLLQPAFLAQKIDLLPGVHQQPGLLAEHRVQAVACEVTHPFRDVAVGTNGHDSEDERPTLGLRDRRRTRGQRPPDHPAGAGGGESGNAHQHAAAADGSGLPAICEPTSPRPHTRGSVPGCS